MLVLHKHSCAVDAERAAALLRSAFPASTHADESENALLGSHNDSFDIRAVEVWQNEDLLAIAFAKRVKVKFDQVDVDALSVGSVAVHPSVQGRGVGRLLMGGIDDLARAVCADVIYLQGIPNFYQRFGYFPMLAKSKIRVDLSCIRDVSSVVCVRPATPSDIPELSEIYLQLTRGISGSAYRGAQTWNWLLGPATRSWYFQSPQVVELDGAVIGYFCCDRHNPNRVRELVYRLDSRSIHALLFGLKTYLQHCNVSDVELMTWRDSMLHQELAFRMTMQFVELSSPSSGQLIKVLSPADLVRSVLAARLQPQIHSPQVEMLGDSVSITIESEKAIVNLKTVVVWLFGILSLEVLLKRGDISLVGAMSDSPSEKFSRIFKSESAGAFVFQGDNL